MNKIGTALIGKELRGFFKDRRTLAMILLPGIMMYVVYSLMGSILTRQQTETTSYRVAVVQYQNDLHFLDNLFPELTRDSFGDIQSDKEKIRKGTLDLLIVLPENFLQTAESDKNPNVQVYYNSGETASSRAYQLFSEAIEQYRYQMFPSFTVNADSDEFDLASDEDIFSDMVASLIPMLLLVTLISTCMSIGAESFAGEKERGTLNTLLMTPISREEIAAGKVISLSIVGLIAGLSTFIGVLLAMPELAKAFAGKNGMSSIGYSVVDYTIIACIIFSTVLFLMALVAILSALAKGTKEANLFGMPLSVVGIAVSFLVMAQNGDSAQIPQMFIPLYNTAVCLKMVLSGSAHVMEILAMAAANLVYTGLLLRVLGYLLRSERVLFG